jgi:hypothetical protein
MSGPNNALLLPSNWVVNKRFYIDKPIVVLHSGTKQIMLPKGACFFNLRSVSLKI